MPTSTARSVRSSSQSISSSLGRQAADTLAPRCFGRMRLASLTRSGHLSTVMNQELPALVISLLSLSA